MNLLQNNSGQNLWLQDSASGEWYVLPHGQSFKFTTDNTDIQYVYWDTNYLGNPSYYVGVGWLSDNESTTLLGVYTVGTGPSVGRYDDYSWIAWTVLVLWALWLTQKMMVRIFSRSFGAASDNTIDA